MFVHRELTKRIEKKREEIASLEKQLAEARAYLMALEESMKIVSRAGGNDVGEVALRPGSDLAKVRDCLRKAGKAMHIVKIIEGIGKEANKGNRVSLSGSLSSYVRKGLIFTRPAPNTFGLVELGETDGTDDDDIPVDPPDGFGDFEDTEDEQLNELPDNPVPAKHAAVPKPIMPALKPQVPLQKPSPAQAADEDDDVNVPF